IGGLGRHFAGFGARHSSFTAPMSFHEGSGVSIASPAQRGTMNDDRGIFLLSATRKGAWIYRGDGARERWQVSGPHFLGHVIHHGMLDPRDGRTVLLAARTGHLGPTVFRSTDGGERWTEASRPPAFAKAPPGTRGRVVDHVFWLTP